MNRDRCAMEMLATWAFCLGLVLVQSGWGAWIAQTMNDRPSWSVCGQDLCLCQPIEPIERKPDDCPLCATGLPADKEVCEGVAPRTSGSLRVLLNTNDSASTLGLLGGATNALLIGFFLNAGAASEPVVSATVAVRVEDWVLPSGRSERVPTPPPRA